MEKPNPYLDQIMQLFNNKCFTKDRFTYNIEKKYFLQLFDVAPLGSAEFHSALRNTGSFKISFRKNKAAHKSSLLNTPQGKKHFSKSHL